jgi:hypothetical protein
MVTHSGAKVFPELHPFGIQASSHCSRQLYEFGVVVDRRNCMHNI